ncbi:MAG: carbohydrate ABC transporter permease [Phototrophicaceae bacterium]
MNTKQFTIFVAPSVVIMIALMIVPLIAAIWLGFHFITFRNVTTPQWVGLENYLYMLGDARFWNSLRFTLFYIVMTVPLHIVLGLVVALLLDQIKGLLRGVYMSATLLPFIITPIVGTLVYRQTFDRYGIYPYLLDQWFGIDINFFTGDNIMFLIFSQALWYITPFAIVTLFAGLQTVPQEPLEAALVDGTTWLERLWYIVIPHLQNLFIFIALISIMDAYRVFDSIFVLTKQNPIYTNVETLMYYNYQVAVQFQNLGRANAMSVLTVVGIFFILIPFLIVTYRQQVEER